MTKLSPEERLVRKRARDRVYYEANKQHKLERGRAWRRANPERVSARNRAYREVNRDHVYALTRAWQEANPDVLRKSRQARNRRPIVMLDNAKRRAAKKNLEYDLDKLWLDDLYARQNGCCAVTGLPLDEKTAEKGIRNPFAISIDRIDNSKGYTRANCRLVCAGVNLAMNEWGESVFLKFAYAVVEHHKRTYA